MPAAFLTVSLATGLEVTQVSPLVTSVSGSQTSHSVTLLVPHPYSLLSHDCLAWAWTPYFWSHYKCVSPLEQMSELQEC